MNHYLLRREKLRRLLKAEGLDAILVTDFTNVSYLTGFTGDDSYLLVHAKGDVILSDSRYEIQISEECPGLEASIRPSTLALLAAVKKLVSTKSTTKLGLEANHVTLCAYETIRENLAKCEIKAVSDCVEKLRTIKDKYEIASLRKSIASAEKAFELIRCSLLAGQTEIEIRNDLEYAMRKFGAEDKGFASIVAVGSRAALPHAVPTLRRVEEAELLLIDWGAKREGYVSDLTRTLVTKSKPSAKLRQIYEAVLRAQKAAIAAIRPGVVASEIDRIARKSLEKSGYEKYFTHGLGHGIGRHVHESGGFSARSEMVLQSGMVMTVEPGVYLPGWGGVRIEDDVLITKDGCEVLTSVAKEFDEMITLPG